MYLHAVHSPYSVMTFRDSLSLVSDTGVIIAINFTTLLVHLFSVSPLFLYYAMSSCLLVLDFKLF